jgi:Flp pilus assembly protein TadG
LLWKLCRFRKAQSGAAAVEFALVLPIMLMLYIGANEASALVSMDRKVQFISGAVGDLVARSENGITGETLLDYVNIASGIISPYVAPDMEQIVTQVKVSSSGEAVVDWSKGYKNQVLDSSLGLEKNSIYKLPEAVTKIAPGQYVIIAETRLPYLPLYGIIFDAPVTLSRANFYLPRFGGRIDLK